MKLTFVSPDYTAIPTTSEDKTVLFHTLWRELHTEVRTKEQFENWISRVPSFGCGCLAWLKAYIAKQPYPVGTQIEVKLVYGWTLHNAVNAKLSAEGKDRPEFSWAEFERKYPRSREGF